MSKYGQAKVLSNDEIDNVLAEIEHHRYPAKNALMIQVSFKLGLRAQEMSLLRIREVATLGQQFPRGYQVLDLMVLPSRFTKGARAFSANSKRSEHKKTAAEIKNEIKAKKNANRSSVRFTIAEFDRLVADIEKDVKARRKLDPSDYYPKLKEPGGKTRELPLVDQDLIDAIERCLDERVAGAQTLKPNAPLFLSQKCGPYTPNTLQAHIAKMLRQWSGISRASSHSGRRTLATKLLQEEGAPIKAVQKVLGHKTAATTAIYHDVTEEKVKEIMKGVGNKYRGK